MVFRRESAFADILGGLALSLSALSSRSSKTLSFFLLLVLATGFTSFLALGRAASTATSGVTNIVANPSFEDPNSKAWFVGATYGGGVVTINDTTNSHTGSHSALLSAVNTTLQCTGSECKDTVRGTVEQYVQFNNPPTLNNLAATNDSFSAWWYVANPSSTGLPTYSLHVGLFFSDGSSIEYFYGTSDLANQRYNLGPIPATGSWFQMRRNLLSDIQGVVVNPSTTRITTVWFGAFGGTSQSTPHGEKAWVDDVALDFNTVSPDFFLRLSVPPSGALIVAGEATSVTVYVFPTSGFSGQNSTVTLMGKVFPSVGNGPVLSLNPAQASLDFGTSTLTISTSVATPPGNYTIMVTGTSEGLTHSVQFLLTVLPPPVLKVTPTSGTIGQLVTVQGSGFVNPSQGAGFSGEVDVTFDNQFVGFTFLQGSSFNFSFSVPLSQPGIVHHIHAIELFPFQVDVQADFTVLASPSPSAFSVGVTVGTLYFPGDTAVISVQTSLNGQPTPVSSLQIILVKPNGSTVTLTPVQVSPGEWRATYAVPGTGSIGTYVVVVRAHQQASDSSALGGFEVKPTWLQSHGSTVVGAASIVGAFGMLAVAWKKGFLTRRKDELPI